MADALLHIEVAYARPEKQHLIAMRVAAGTTARQAALQSGLATLCPDLDLQHCPLGVFGSLVADDYAVGQGDRIEIYRPLLNDPREKRRQLAARGEVMGSGTPGKS